MTPTSNDNATVDNATSTHSATRLPSPGGAYQYANAGASFRLPGPRNHSVLDNARSTTSASFESIPFVRTAPLPLLPPLTLAPSSDTAQTHLPLPQLQRRFRRKSSIALSIGQQASHHGEQDPFVTPCLRVSYWMPPALPLEGGSPLLPVSPSVSAASPRPSIYLPPSFHLPNLEEDLEHHRDQGRGSLPWHGIPSLRHREQRTCILQP
jgi:hypothetical protein